MSLGVAVLTVTLILALVAGAVRVLVHLEDAGEAINAPAIVALLVAVLLIGGVTWLAVWLIGRGLG